MAGTSYTRQSTLTDGDTITASLFNAEYNQLVSAFSYAASATTGHQHDGSSGEGGNIHTIGDQDFNNKIVVDSTNNRWSVYVEVGGTAVEQVRIEDGVVYPVTDSDVDLGTNALRFKNAYIDSLTATGNLTVGGNITVTGNVDVDGIVEFDGLSGTGSVTVTDILDQDDMVSNSATALATQQSIKAYVDAQVTAQDLDLTDGTTSISIDLDSEALSVLGGTGVTSTASGNGVTLAIDSTVTTLTGTQTLTNKTLTSPDVNTPDIDGGTIDGTVIGGTTAAAGSFTTVGATGNITVGGTVDGRDVAADGTKLDTVETNADVTDTANVTAAGALMDSELTSIASVKALNQGVATTDSPTFAAATVTGEITANGGIALGDNDKATFGDSDDLKIYHSSSSFIREQGNGGLYIDSDGGHVTIRVNSSEKAVEALNDGAVNLYHDNSEKLATTATGIDVTGNVVADGLTVDGSGTIASFKRDAGANGQLDLSFPAQVATLNASSSLAFQTAATERMRLTSTGLGIGTSSPDVKLHLSDSTSGSIIRLERNDTAIVAGDIYGGIEFEGQDASTTASGVRGSITGVGAGGAGNMDLVFNTAKGGTTDNLQRLRISSIGDISFYEDTGTTAKLFWDASAESLGIGTSSPAALLDVNIDGNTGRFSRSGTQYIEVSASSGGQSILSTSGTNKALNIGTTDSNQVRLQTNGSNALTIDASQNVGIGTDSPVSTLELANNNQAAGSTLSITNSFTGDDWNTNDLIGTIDFRTDDTSTSQPVRGSIKSIVENTSGATSPAYTALSFSTASVNTLAERMRIDSAGNVGIGTDSPFHNLSVNSSSTGIISVGDFTGDNVKTYIEADQTNNVAKINSRNTHPLAFSVHNTERMRIDASGYVGIGTSSPSSYFSPQLVVHSSSNLGGITIRSNATTDTNYLLFADGTSSNERYRGYVSYDHNTDTMKLAAGASPAITIDSSGSVGIGTSSNFGKLSVNVSSGAPATSGNMTNGLTVHNTDGGRAIQLGVNDSGQYTFINSGYVNSAGNSQPMAFFTGGTERMRIRSNGTVNILGAGNTAGGNLALGDNDDGRAKWSYLTGAHYDAATESEGVSMIGMYGSDGNNSVFIGGGIYETNPATNIQFWTHTASTHAQGGTERMRIDGSGNLLVGTAATTINTSSSVAGHNLFSSGYTVHSRSGQTVMSLNRLSTDGTIVDFRKNGTAVGSIGSHVNGLLIGTTEGSDAFLKFESNVLRPSAWDGSYRDAAIDLGHADSRFKNLKLSGKAIVGSGSFDGGGVIHDYGSDGNSRSWWAKTDTHGYGDFAIRQSTTQTGSTYQTRLLINSSGNLLVGTTDDVVWDNSADSAADNGHNLRDDGRAGFAYYNATANSNATVNINRTGSNGDLIRFFKSGTNVGSIGVVHGNNLFIGAPSHSGLQFGGSIIYPTNGTVGNATNGAVDLGGVSTRFKDLYLSNKAYIGSGSLFDTGGDISLNQGSRGIRINDAASAISPTNGGAANGDATTDLGVSNIRFRDLYLSGGVYLGGTGAANKLDDYEEGTWTPFLDASSTDPSLSYSTQVGAYEKIGALIHASFFINVSAVNSQGSGQLRIAGLPFNAVSNVNASEVPAVLLQTEPFNAGDGAGYQQYARTNSNSNLLIMGYKTGNGSAAIPSGANNVGTGYLIGHIVYKTDA